MTPASDFDVAIIGMAGRFPGAKDIAAFWDNLRNGREGITFFSDEELEGYRDPRPNFVKAKGVIQDIDLFDADFFNISAREAEWLDPQQRLFLQGAWEALENAGYDPLTYPGQISVYAGVNTNTYLLSRLGNLQGGDPANDFRILLASEKDHLATRIAYKLNLRGESLTVQTSCSTSLVAVHLAYQSVLSGQSHISLAGGISIRVPQKTGYLYQEGMVGSPDGHCRPFDSRAKGTVPGHGFGIVVLKLLSDALRDRDTIYAVIKGSAINNDGSNKVGYTAPSVEGQASVIAKALAMADVNPEQITFVEAHGTGTPLGDPIEVEALTRVYRKHTQRKQYCMLGAVKSMIGHLDNAAGVAGLIKTVLALRHREIPPTLHFETANPMLNLESSPFRVNTALLPWRPDAEGLYAGVSSFGIGGTNVHMIVAEGLQPQPATSRDQSHIVTLSAKSPQALKRMSEELALHLEQDPDLDLADVAFTRNAGRHAFEHRTFAIGSTREEIRDSLRKAAARGESKAVSNVSSKLAFLFPGQGSQKLGATRQLYEEWPEFRHHIDQCFQFVRSKFGLDLHNCLYGPHSDVTEAARKLAQPGISLPTLFSIEYSLAQLWISWGIRPHVLFGHSFGEYVAACLAGVFTLEEGLWLSGMRGKLIEERLQPGAMTAVRLSAQEVAPSLESPVVVSANNSRGDCTISGPIGSIDQTETRLREKSIAFRRLNVPYAYHSSMVESMLDEFAGALKQVELKRPGLPLVSSLTGSWIDPDQIRTTEYWLAQMRQTVQFAPAMDLLQQSSVQTYLELGPSPALGPLALQHFGKEKIAVFSALDASSVSKGENRALLKTVGGLWSSGFNVDWPSFYRHDKYRRIPLPSYPFECRRYWIEPRPVEMRASADATGTAVRQGEISMTEHANRNGHSRTETIGEQTPPTPRNELEQALLEIWTEVLGYSNIGTTDSFFQLGGDSLTAVQVYSRIKQVVAADVTLEMVLSAPTIRELSRSLQKQIKRTAGMHVEDDGPDTRYVVRLQIEDEEAEIHLSEEEFKKLPETSPQLVTV